MILVALDEYGKFEKEDIKPTKVCFVGGYLFKGKDENAIQNERNRLYNWLKTITEDCGGVFPKDLHSATRGNSSESDTEWVIKNMLSDTFSDFTTTDKYGVPFGEYKFYIMLGDMKNGPKIFSDNVKGNITSDDTASNRYEHMAYSVVENLLHYIAEEQIVDSVQLELATRIYGQNNNQNEYKDSGHSESYHSESETMFCITTPDSFRGMLYSVVPHTELSNAHFIVNVKPINYKAEKELDIKNNVFLYLADIVCDFLKNITFKNKGKKIGELLLEIENVYKNSVLWAYHNIEDDRKEAVKAYQKGDFFTALKQIYKIKQNLYKDNDLVKYYENKWLKGIENNIKQSTDLNALINSIVELEKMNNSSDFSNRELEYILGILEENRLLNNEDGNKTLLFRLNAVKMIMYNHFGDADRARVAFEEAEQYSEGATIRELCELRNRRSVSLIDNLSYLDAKSFTEDTCAFIGDIRDWTKSYFSAERLSIDLARANSQLGQVYSFLKQYNNAENSFLKALDLMKDSPKDRIRTMSYLLHMYIESGNKEEFEKYAKEYFQIPDGKGFYDVDKFNWANDEMAFVYALFVYIKALYVLYTDGQGDKKFIEWFNQKANTKLRNEHPAELIYKYLAFICYRQGNVKQAEKIMSKTEECVENSVTSSELLKQQVEYGKTQFERLNKGTCIFSKEDILQYTHR